MRKETQIKPNNLPQRAIPFVNRDQQLSQATKALLDPHISIVTLTGVGGIGKTALALEIAHRLLEDSSFAGGIVWLSCRATENLSEFLGRIDTVLSLGASDLLSDESYITRLQDRVTSHLRRQRCLLIFDGLDEVIDEKDILGFLDRLPNPSKALITSRKTTGLLGQELSIAIPLLGEAASAQLIKIVADEIGVKVAEGERAELALMADGHPLVLNMLTRLIRTTSLSELRSRFLATEFNESPIEEAFELSYQKLSEKARRILQVLSVFEDGAVSTAIEFISGDKNWEKSVQELRNLSLLSVEDERLTLHPIVRRLTLKKLDETNKRKEIEELVAGFFLVLAQWAISRRDAEDASAIPVIIKFERNNLITFLHWYQKQERWDDVIRYGLMLGELFQVSGDLSERLEALEIVLAATNKVKDERLQAIALHNLGIVYQEMGQYDRARSLYQRSLENKTVRNDPQGLANTLHQLALLEQAKGNYEQARILYQQNLETTRKLGDKAGVSSSLYQLATLAQMQGEYSEAERLFVESIKIEQELGNKGNLTIAQSALGSLYQLQGDYSKAIQLYTEALRTAEQLGNRQLVASTLNRIGSAFSEMGDSSGALEYYEKALASARNVGTPEMVSDILSNLGALYGNQGNLELAEKYFSESLSISKEIGDYEGISILLSNLGSVALSRGNLERAESYLREGLSLASSSNQQEWVIRMLSNLGRLESKRGNLEQAEEYLKEALATARSINSANSVAPLLTNLARVAFNRGNLTLAKTYLEQSLSLAQRTNDLHGIALVDLLRSEIAEAEGDFNTAIGLVARSLSTSPSSESPNYELLVERLARLRERLGAEKFQESLKNVDVILPEEILRLKPSQSEQMPLNEDWASLARRYENEQKWSEAIEAYRKALSFFTQEEKENKWEQYAAIKARLGICLRQAERWVEALELQKENFEIFKKTNEVKGQADTLMEIALLNQLINNYEEAWLHYLDAYRLYSRVDNGKGEKLGMAAASEALGTLEFYARMFPQAIQDLGDAHKLYESLGLLGKAALVNETLSAARKALEERDTAINSKVTK